MIKEYQIINKETDEVFNEVTFTSFSSAIGCFQREVLDSRWWSIELVNIEWESGDE